MIETPTFLLQDVLTKELEIPGTMPVIITVPHDGRSTTIEGQGIMRIPGGTPGDRNVRFIAKDLCRFVEEEVGVRPTLLIDPIKRDRRWATIPIFDAHVIDAVGRVAETFEGTTTQSPVLFDLHGFVNQPPFGHYDLILGTAHRKSTPSGIDVRFGDFMTDRGYAVYVPGETCIEGELFAAESPHTLTRKASQNFPTVDCIQVEIHQGFRTVEGRERGVELARDMADFVVEYTAANYYTQD